MPNRRAIRASLVYTERDNYGYNPYLDERLKGEDVVAGNLSRQLIDGVRRNAHE